MERTIIIHGPSDIPYGQLSNTSFTPFILDGKRWNTVENYVYANMVTSPIHQILLQTAKIQGDKKKTNTDDKVRQLVANREVQIDRALERNEIEQIRASILNEVMMQKLNIYQLYSHLYSIELYNTIRSAVEKTYRAQLSRMPEMESMLLSTGNRPIIYSSTHSLLGVNIETNKGANIIGNVLMQLRYQLFNNQKVQESKKNINKRNIDIINAYTTYTILQHEATKDYFQEYKDLSQEEIVKLFVSKNPTIRLENLGISKDFDEDIISKYNRGIYSYIKPEIENPGTTFMLIRNKKREENEITNKNIILGEYILYVLKKKGKIIDNPNETIQNFIMSSPTIEDYLDLQERIINLYKEQKLPSKLIEKIQKKLIIEAKEMEEKESEHETGNENEESNDISSMDEIKERFASDSNQLKLELLKRLQSYTGKKLEYYREWTTDKIERYLSKYEMGKSEPKTKGAWVVYVKGKKYDEYEEKPSIKRIKKRVGNEEIKIVWKSEVKKEIVEEEGDLELGVKATGKPIYLYADIDEKNELSSFSPIHDSPFIIDEIEYPNLSTFIIVSMLSQTGKTINPNKNKMISKGMPTREAVKLLKKDGVFLSPEEAIGIYENIENETDNELFATFLKIALNKKFEDISLQNLLLLTDKKHIICSNTNDLLGKDSNLAGKYLDELRTTINNYREKNPFPRILQLQVGEFLMSDSFMSSWLRMRVADICFVVNLMKEYTEIITGEATKVDVKLLENAIDRVYQPCSAVFTGGNDIVEIPDSFIHIVSGCNFQSTRADINERIEKIKIKIKDEERSYNTVEKKNLGEQNEFMSGIYQSLSVRKKKEEMDSYNKEKSNVKTAEEKKEHETIIKEYKKELQELVASKKQEEKSNNISKTDAINVIWSRLSRCLSFVIGNRQDLTQQDLRKIIASAEMLNSNKITCQLTPQNLKDDEETCAASAIANILTGLQLFKKTYKPLKEYKMVTRIDIETAGSIILRRKEGRKEESEVQALPEVIQVLEENSDDENDVKSENGQTPVEFEIGDEVDLEAVEIDYGNAIPEDEEFSFNPKKPNKKVEILKIVIREISGKELENLDELASYYSYMINRVKKFGKTNRINFFATMKQ